MFDIFFLPFFQRALLVGLMMALAAAVLGVFVVVRRMAFFTDAVAHASITGVALALLIGVHPFVGALVVSLIVGLLVARLSRRGTHDVDTIIGVLFSSALAFGVVLMSMLPRYRGNLFMYLFGDILTLQTRDVFLGAGLLIVVLVGLYFLFTHITRIAVHEDVARVDGVRVALVETFFLLLLSLVVTAGLTMVGGILMGALMILPAATAQQVTRTFRGMVVVSAVCGMASMFFGLCASAIFGTPSGPTVVLVSAILFSLAALRGILSK
jgi:zinc transport system permease protein